MKNPIHPPHNHSITQLPTPNPASFTHSQFNQIHQPLNHPTTQSPTSSIQHHSPIHPFTIHPIHQLLNRPTTQSLNRQHPASSIIHPFTHSQFTQFTQPLNHSIANIIHLIVSQKPTFKRVFKKRTKFLFVCCR
ncbi:hypothetical protein NBC122_02563 [Chryseobacterium salivictor]|uniref:Uncharacterized protein n=1 Tax=Chryseobacterium salivictor TaxID=2547600 RepID=A0A4P6ZIJ5_9FLAO|nr:hypothetical protein NBC122_02563 [Chryseobacterium salivictor]